MKNLIVALIGKMKSIIASIRKNAEEALSWLNAIEKDKYQHYALGAAIAAAIFFASPDRKSTRLNSSHTRPSRMPSSA